MNGFLRDISHAWKTILRQRAMSLVVVLMLAPGIGINTAMFSMTWHVLLAPLPYQDGDRLVKLEQREPGNMLEDIPWTLPALTDLREQNTVFSSVVQYFATDTTLYSDNSSFVVNYAAVDGNFFTTLGLQPAHGRLLVPADDRSEAPPAMVLGIEFWTKAFNGDPAAIGRTVEMNGLTYTVVGVLPEIPPYPRTNDVWVAAANDWVMSNEMVLSDRSSTSGLVSHVIGKLADGISLAQTQQDVDLFAARLRSSYPEVYREAVGYSIRVEPLKASITGTSERTVGLLMSLAVLVALIASTNFATITLAGMTRRRQELAIREAVGASPQGIRRQLITEGILISVMGGVAGLALAALAVGFITDFASIYTPLATEITLNGSVLVFSLALVIVTGLSSALLASLQAQDINHVLKEGGDNATASAGMKGIRDILLAAQCALAFVMLTSTALMTASLYALINQPTGYETDGVVLLSTTMRGTDPATMWPERDMMLQVMEETRALPGVTAAGLSGQPLLQGPGFPPGAMRLEGRDVDGGNLLIREAFTIVSPGFFDAMSIPLLAGRGFSINDDENAPDVIMVNETFATRHFPGESALGKRISFDRGNTWATIIGIVSDIRARGIDQPDIAMVYTNYVSSPTQIINLYVKSRGDLRQTADAVAAIIKRLDPLQPVDSIAPLEEIRARWLAPAKLRTGMIAAFGFLAVFVTLAGVIGVVSCNISQRVREIGVHMAVGATPTRISHLFISQGMKTCLSGLSLGLVLMLAAAPVIEPLLYETAALNAGVYLGSTAVLMAAILIALYLPARKAGRMSPVVAIHAD